jgi:hypothetical protein
VLSGAGNALAIAVVTYRLLREGKHGVEYWALVVDPANRGQAAPRRPPRQRRPFRRSWASTSAPSLMLRTASAKPFPAASAEEGAVIAAGMSTTVASNRKSGMPRRRARTEA